MAALKIYPEDTSDSEKKGTFHGFSLSVLLWGVAKTGHYYTRALYPWGSECCSNMSVTFNVGEADKMRTLYYVLYHLHLFKKGTHGNKQAPTEIPDHEVLNKIYKIVFFTFYRCIAKLYYIFRLSKLFLQYLTNIKIFEVK